MKKYAWSFCMAISVEQYQAGVDTVTLYGPRLMSLADTSGV
jgi:hypothetical protein